jgi:GMP synthase-like glutamine amidotransferase
MTKSLVVNCSLKSSNEALIEAVRKFSECAVVQFRDVSLGFHIDQDVDSVVISGSGARIVDPSHRAIFDGVVNLVKTCNLPLLGICFGHQLLCWAFGAEAGSLAQGAFEGFENIRVLEPAELFAGFEKVVPLPLAENHYDYVVKDSLDKAGFRLLADSASCEVEAVKHKIRPFYGVQFHPERICVKGESHPEGHRVIENFYRNVVRR